MHQPPERAGIEQSDARDYPPEWDKVAEIRVFRSAMREWERLISWRGDMKKKGWKLLRVSTGGDQLYAIFGRTREDLGHGGNP